MIIFEVNIKSIFTFEFERDAPIAANGDTPGAFGYRSGPRKDLADPRSDLVNP